MTDLVATYDSSNAQRYDSNSFFLQSTQYDKLYKHLDAIKSGIDEVNKLQIKIRALQSNEFAHTAFSTMDNEMNRMYNELQAAVDDFKQNNKGLIDSIGTNVESTKRCTAQLQEYDANFARRNERLDGYLSYLDRYERHEKKLHSEFMKYIYDIEKELHYAEAYFYARNDASDIYKAFGSNEQRIANLYQRLCILEQPPKPVQQQVKCKLDGHISQHVHYEDATATFADESLPEHCPYDGVLSFRGHSDNPTISVEHSSDYPTHRNMSGTMPYNAHGCSATISQLSVSINSDI